MKYNSTLVLMLTLTLSACSPEKSGRTPVANAVTPTTPVNAEKTVGKTELVEAKTHILQITALNFLQGGLEQCTARNKVFSFTQQDKNVRTTICKNSLTEVFVVSDAGVVQFHTTDRTNGRELPSSSSAFDQSYELGKERPMLRYSAINPYGFTYVMAEEVTGIDPALLAQWNELNSKLANLRAQILTAQQSGQTVPTAVLDELRAVEAKMEELARQMEIAR